MVEADAVYVLVAREFKKFVREKIEQHEKPCRLQDKKVDLKIMGPGSRINYFRLKFKSIEKKKP